MSSLTAQQRTHTPTPFPSADPKYCRTCYPEFEIPHLDALHARHTGVWVPFVDPAAGNRWEVHAPRGEVTACVERDQGERMVQGVRATLGSRSGLVPTAGI